MMIYNAITEGFLATLTGQGDDLAAAPNFILFGRSREHRELLAHRICHLLTDGRVPPVVVSAGERRGDFPDPAEGDVVNRLGRLAACGNVGSPSRRRVIILSDADLLSIQQQLALRKVIEATRDNLYILCTPFLHAVEAALVSRCQPLNANSVGNPSKNPSNRANSAFDAAVADACAKLLKRKALVTEDALVRTARSILGKCPDDDEGHHHRRVRIAVCAVLDRIASPDSGRDLRAEIVAAAAEADERSLRAGPDDQSIVLAAFLARVKAAARTRG